MAFKKTTDKIPADIETFTVEVLNAREFKPVSKKIDTSIGFSMKVNGITIYNCIYNAGTSEKGEWDAINFPQTKGKDDKYYNEVWFPINKDLKGEIVKQLEALV